MINHYGCFLNRKEAKLFDKSAEGNLNFFHGKSHPDAITRTHSEREESILIQVAFIFSTPPKE